MAIEEITLSVPLSLPESGSREHIPGEAVNPDDQMVRRYARMLEARYRFAWTRRGRRKRLEAFEAGYRSLVKQFAKEVTAPIDDRSIRLDARTRIYASLTGILAAATADQRRLRDRAFRLFGWGLALCGVGLGGLAAMLALTV